MFKYSTQGKPPSAEMLQKFEEHFWNWFDALPPKTRATFHNYPADMAKLYFENKVWPELIKSKLLSQ